MRIYGLILSIVFLHSLSSPAFAQRELILPNTGPDLSQLSDLMKEIQERPLNDENVISFIKTYQLKLPPAFLYELSERTFTKNVDEALDWFLLANIRARYDGLRCKDMTATQGILYLPDMHAGTVTNYIMKDITVLNAAAARLLQRKDIFSNTADPWWICIHGMRAVLDSMYGKPSTDYLTDETEWQTLRDKLTASLEKPITQ